MKAFVQLVFYLKGKRGKKLTCCSPKCAVVPYTNVLLRLAARERAGKEEGDELFLSAWDGRCEHDFRWVTSSTVAPSTTQYSERKLVGKTKELPDINVQRLE